MTQDRKDGPIAKLREHALSAEVWENRHESGASHNVTFSRAYRDSEGKWQSTSSFGERDLLPLQHLAGRAHDSIRERKNKLRQDERPKENRTRSRGRDHER
tara:strand:+ start:2928 stop:3230 length:303 start_codon:yes stop_codon:yes gene_type:complete